ncbi:hypothetical protein DH2020_014065 [Rehmannia glutinosa]|uniref:R2R3-MYB protein n=1 Tax=Rehmannia glutinosa TaxID=99300 RepID=A0ABR0WW27_REHGL
MGRPPCCDKVAIKKGPWNPEEDIILVSYIQQHGPGNWRAVPTNTGLLRCSKSCRLRWTNYLRPGIKRGNFTPHEEGMIIHLQALLGNKWAAIASYLPQRTDNDIKNYWNTHLKKRLKRFQSATYDHHQFMSKNYVQHENSSSSVYASSEENISRLLEGWMGSSSSTSSIYASNNSLVKCCMPREIDHINVANGIKIDDDQLQCILSHCDHGLIDSVTTNCDCSGNLVDHQEKAKSDYSDPPLSFLEKWLMDESAIQVEGDIEIPDPKGLA